MPVSEKRKRHALIESERAQRLDRKALGRLRLRRDDVIASCMDFLYMTSVSSFKRRRRKQIYSVLLLAKVYQIFYVLVDHLLKGVSR